MKTIKWIAAALMINCMSFGSAVAHNDDPVKKQTNTIDKNNYNNNFIASPILKKESKVVMDEPGFRNAIGIRAGGASGLTFKHRFTSGNAFEGIVGFWPNAFGLTGLYEMYVPSGAKGLNWYFGGGGHMAAVNDRNVDFWNEGNRRYYSNYWTDEPAFGLGVDGIAGIEYKVPRAPFAFSFDFKPFFEVNSHGGAAVGLDPALGIKVAW